MPKFSHSHMQACTACQGCPHCTHRWQQIRIPGHRARRVYGGYRRFLPMNSPWRRKSFRWNGHVYYFKDVERRNWSKPRTMRTFKECVAHTTKPPFCGHKGPPLRSLWTAFDPRRSMCDIMHDLKCACECVLKGLVGYGKHGMYKSWNKDSRHRRECIALDMFPEVHDDDSPLRWRLTREELHIVNKRICDMGWPHYTHKLAKHGASFFVKSCRCWKCRDKLEILMVILPTCLRDFVPAVHQALLELAFALRRLEGQVVSSAEAKRLGIMPGSRVVDKKLFRPRTGI